MSTWVTSLLLFITFALAYLHPEKDVWRPGSLYLLGFVYVTFLWGLVIGVGQGFERWETKGQALCQGVRGGFPTMGGLETVGSFCLEYSALGGSAAMRRWWGTGSRGWTRDHWIVTGSLIAIVVWVAVILWLLHGMTFTK